MTTINGEYVPSPNPKPHPRIKPEANEYAERNRGNTERWFDYTNSDGFETQRPVGRAITDEARRNADTNKGCMSDIMGGHADAPIQKNVHSRAVTGDASEIVNQNKGESMKELIDNYGNVPISKKPGPKVHGAEAEQYAERNLGTVNLLNNLTLDQPPPQKVSNGGEYIAAAEAGKGPILHMEGVVTATEPKISNLQGAGLDHSSSPVVRTTPEAEGVYEKQGSEIAGDLLKGEVPPLVRDPKLHAHLPESATSRPQMSPSRARPESAQYFKKNQSSEMSAIMHGVSTANAPIRKSHRMMMKSEDW